MSYKIKDKRNLLASDDSKTECGGAVAIICLPISFSLSLSCDWWADRRYALIATAHWPPQTQFLWIRNKFLLSLSLLSDADPGTRVCTLRPVTGEPPRSGPCVGRFTLAGSQSLRDPTHWSWFTSFSFLYILLGHNKFLFPLIFVDDVPHKM